MRKFLFVLAAFFAAAGCDALEPRLNTSSPEAYQRSLAAVKEGMTAEEKKEFEAALFSLALAELDIDKDAPFASLAAISSTTPESVLKSIGPELNGKTAKQVVVLGYRKQLDRTDEQIKTIAAEVEQAQSALLDAKTKLDALKVSGAKFYWDRSFIDNPVIDFQLENTGKIPLARVYFHGLLETPGRSIPWVSEEFNHEIAGGLEPGETQHFQLEPNMFGEWSNAPKDRRDMILTVTVVNFEGPDGQELLKVTPDEVAEKAKALDELRASRDALAKKLKAP